MGKNLAFMCGLVLVLMMAALYHSREQNQSLSAELEAVRAENSLLRQQKILADETAESARKSLEEVNAQNKLYKASIEEALKASHVWAGTLLPDDIASVLQQNYCFKPAQPSDVPAP